MHEFFTEFLILLIVATAVAIVFDRLKLSSILGFLLCGVVIGPKCLQILSNPDSIHELAELGIIFLMLTIGLEFSFDKLRGLKRVAIWGGLAQMVTSILLGIGAAKIFGWTYIQGFILGAVIAMSSTAVVFKYLLDRGELETQHGRIAVAILVFQDLAFIPLIILVQGLGQSSLDFAPSLVSAGIRASLFLLVIFLVSKLILVRLIQWVGQTKNHEIFYLVIIAICFASAWLSNAMGLSMAIGAFFAGLMFANTKYTDQISSGILGFRYVFVSVFFVSIGLLLDPIFLLNNLALILSICAVILIVNFIVTFVVVMAVGYSPRIALTSSIILAQIGEFSFLLLEAGRTSNTISFYYYQVFLSVAFISIFVTPFLFNLVPWFIKVCERIPFFGMPPGEKKNAESINEEGLRDHVIICGFGNVGYDIATSLKNESIPYIALEMNSKNIERAHKDGTPIIFGDSNNEHILKKAGIQSAKALVISFSDHIGAINIVRMVQRINPDIYILVRSRYEHDVPRFFELGVDMVCMEELETSLELNRLMLEKFKIPKDRIHTRLEKIRERKEVAIEEAIFKRATGLDSSK